MQQKAGVRQAHNLPNDPMASLESRPLPRPPPRSVLKRAGQKSRGFRVSINESKNEVVESDYIILVQDEEEPQLVSIKALDLSVLTGGTSGVDILTLSPPDGYKDCFGRALHQTINDDSDNECIDSINRPWKYITHGPDCPKSKIQDMLSPGQTHPHISFENYHNHDQQIEPCDSRENNKTGILKGGKLWKSADLKKSFQRRIEFDRLDEPRRSVRFSGQDQYSMLEPHFAMAKMHHPSELASFLSPQFQSLEMLLGDKQEDWHLELSPIDQNHQESGIHMEGGTVYHLCPKHGHGMEENQMDDEHISESVQRYEEMRRRIVMSEIRDTSSLSSDDSKTLSDNIVDPSTAESRIRRLENSDVAQVAGGIMRSNNEVRRAIERNALRRSLIRFAEARKKDTNKNEKNDKQESSLIEKLKWLTASEDVTNGNTQKKKNEDAMEEENPEEQENPVKSESTLMVQTMEQYRKLAEMFNKSTSSKTSDSSSQAEPREWRSEEEGLQCEPEGIAEFSEDLSLTLTYTAVPVVCEPPSEEDVDKLIYSGGVRYTKEGTLPFGMRPFVNGMLKTPRRLGADGYPLDDGEESTQDDRTSSIASSSQSSPRLPLRNDSETTSITESGYSSNETTSDASHIQVLETDELVDFVRQDTGRIQRIRRKYDDNDDHGFARRPSVRGIKNRFGSTSEIIKQMTQTIHPKHQTNKPPMLNHQCSIEQDTSTSQRKDMVNIRNLPPIEDDISFSSSRSSYITSSSEQLGSEPSHAIRPPKEIHTYVSQMDPRGQCPQRLGVPKESSISRNQRLPIIYPSSQCNSNSSLDSPSSDNLDHHPSCHTRRQTSDPLSLPNDTMMPGSQHPSLLVHGSRPSIRTHPGNCPNQESHRMSQDETPMDLSINFSESSFNTTNSYHEKGHLQYEHHMGIPSTVVSPCGGSVCSHHPHQVSPMQHNPPLAMIPSDSDGACQMRPNKKISQTDHQCDKPACSGWHSLDSRYTNKSMGVTKSLSSTIVSSHMSYTTPIIPDHLRQGSSSIINGGIEHQGIESMPSSQFQEFQKPEAPLNIRSSHSMNIPT